jgi:hypothetical protein
MPTTMFKEVFENLDSPVASICKGLSLVAESLKYQSKIRYLMIALTPPEES